MSFKVKNYSAEEVLAFIEKNRRYSTVSTEYTNDILDSIYLNPDAPQSIRKTANEMCHAEWIRDF